jgi:hypothetical protein
MQMRYLVFVVCQDEKTEHPSFGGQEHSELGQLQHGNSLNSSGGGHSKR